MRYFRHNSKPKAKVLINEKIPLEEFILVDENKNNLGLMSKTEALKLAEEKNLDIMCIKMDKVNQKNSICRLLNYDNYRFKQQKHNRKNLKNKLQIEEKEIRFSASIQENDLKIKIKNCRKFLLQKKKVKIKMRLRGREKYVEKYGVDKIEIFLETIKDLAKITKPPKLENNTYNVLVEPLGTKSKKTNNEKQVQNTSGIKKKD